MSISNLKTLLFLIILIFFLKFVLSGASVENNFLIGIVSEEEEIEWILKSESSDDYESDVNEFLDFLDTNKIFDEENEDITAIYMSTPWAIDDRYALPQIKYLFSKFNEESNADIPDDVNVKGLVFRYFNWEHPVDQFNNWFQLQWLRKNTNNYGGKYRATLFYIYKNRMILSYFNIISNIYKQRKSNENSDLSREEFLLSNTDFLYTDFIKFINNNFNYIKESNIPKNLDFKEIL
eukprot:TRINITY_DN10340_c0_g1_i1.p1 TRINITY_DN10340_c0_g1~~TRINITY_DN10340_c0_g1_i1.p1  ORF type:complete len:236 (-),score=47.30 TRINITY_DN10340_c0_g1_i1:38-745(-)